MAAGRPFPVVVIVGVILAEAAIAVAVEAAGIQSGYVKGALLALIPFSALAWVTRRRPAPERPRE